MRTWINSLAAGLLAGAIILGSLPALAGPYGPGPHRREMRQVHRFHQARRHLAAARRRDARMHHWERARFHRMVYHNRNLYAFRSSYYRPVIWTPIWH
jgi:hypothetical protein